MLDAVAAVGLGPVERLVGALQTNKARDAVRLFDAIESLDRPRLAAALADAMRKEGRRPALLVQVNTGNEPQKAGVPRAEAGAFLRLCRDGHGLEVEGLMCVPPQGEDPRPHFGFLAETAARHGLTQLENKYAQLVEKLEQGEGA